MTRFLKSIDILWADLYPGSAPALHLRHQLGLTCPAILYAGGVLPKGAEAMLFPWQDLLTNRDQLLFTCEADQEIWRRLVRRSNLKEWVVPLGIDETIFHPYNPAERAETRAQYRLPPDAPLLLYVGRFNIQKNLHTLLRLLAEVRAALPQVHLCLVGKEDDIVLGEFQVRNTGYVAWLRRLAADLDLAENITFLEAQFGRDLARLYAAADLLVNTSLYHRENFGLAQAEAQACGLPVVCTAWGGFKDVVLEGETGYLIDAVMTRNGIRVDWATGAQRVIQLLTTPALYAEMQARARAWAEQRFSGAAFTAALAPVLAACRDQNQAVPAQQSVYEPSRFARRYEAHKRRCGWYATSSGRRRYPPMFQGLDYNLYETLIGPYATYQAADLSPRAIPPTWIPYPPSPLRLDPLRQLAADEDPIWSRQHLFLEPLEWAALQLADGQTTAAGIIDALTAHHGHHNEANIRQALWSLAAAGLLIFQRI